MTLTQTQAKTKPALGWRSVSIHHVPLTTMGLNFPNQTIHVLLSVRRDPTIPSSEYQRASRHWRWRATGDAPTDEARDNLPQPSLLSLTFIFHRQNATVLPCITLQSHPGEAVPLKSLICMLEWLPKRFTLRALWRQRPVDCAVDAILFFVFSGLKLHWNALNCAVTSWHIPLQSQQRTALRPCKKRKTRLSVNNTWLLHKNTHSILHVQHATNAKRAAAGV